MLDAKKPAILILEDERIIAANLQQSLGELGYDAYAVATTAAQAIDCAAERRPDLCLVDVRIKGPLDGIAAAEQLAARFGVPIVYLTAHADLATLERAKRTEPYGYLTKPVKLAELQSAVEVALYKHRLDRQLRERERWFSTAMRSIADAVITVDLAGKITFMNSVAEMLTGKRLGDVLGRPASEVLPLGDRDADALSSPLDTALRERRTVHVAEAQLLQRGGTPVLISDSAAPVMDGGEVLGAVMVFRDVTQQRRLERQLELSERLTSLGTLAAGVAHEINNPLTVIVANAEVAREDLRSLLETRGAELPEDLRAAVEQSLAMADETLTAGRRIRGIVTDLRMFSRPAAEPQSSADVGRAVEWALRSTAHELKHRARVVSHIEAVPCVQADASRLGQVLINLLVNAAHAIEPGHAARNEVRVTVRRHGERQVAIEVRDTGCGIPEHVRARLFDPFFTTKPPGLGTGLGLSICHGIVTGLGGALEVESAVGVGSTFRVLLRVADHDDDEPSHAAEATPAGAARRARVLVLDDEDALLSVLRRALAAHDVVCVADADAALGCLEKEQFDVIFSDLMMPNTSGLEFHAKLARRQPELARRVVFITGGATSIETARALELLPNRRVEKPFNVDALREVVRELTA